MHSKTVRRSWCKLSIRVKSAWCVRCNEVPVAWIVVHAAQHMENFPEREPSPTFDSHPNEFYDGFEAHNDSTERICPSPLGGVPEVSRHADGIHVDATVGAPADFLSRLPEAGDTSGYVPLWSERPLSVTTDTTQEDVGVQARAFIPLAVHGLVGVKKNSAERTWMLRTFLGRVERLHANIVRNIRPSRCRLYQFAEDQIQQHTPSEEPIPTAVDPSARKRLLKNLRSRTPAITYNVRRIPAAIRHRWREEFVHPGNFVERFEQNLLLFIEKGKLHKIMDNWHGDKDLAFYYVMPALERSHPMLVALHRVQLDAFSFFLAAGCDIEQRGTVHPYSGDYLSSERDKLQKVKPKQLWKTLLEANAVEGSGSSLSRQLQAFRKYFDCSAEEARNRAVHHMLVLQRIYDASVIADADKKWLKDNCKSWLSYRNAGPLPSENAAGEPYWEVGGVLAMDSANPAQTIDFENPRWWRLHEALSSSSESHMSASVHAEVAANISNHSSVLLRLGVGSSSSAVQNMSFAHESAEAMELTPETGAVTHFDPFYYPPDVSDYLQPIISALCDSSRRGSAAAKDDIGVIVWAWLKAFNLFNKWHTHDIPYDAEDELLGTDAGIAAAVKTVAGMWLPWRVKSQRSLREICWIPR
jgi:hypothetical protein